MPFIYLKNEIWKTLSKTKKTLNFKYIIFELQTIKDKEIMGFWLLLEKDEGNKMGKGGNRDRFPLLGFPNHCR